MNVVTAPAAATKPPSRGTPAFVWEDPLLLEGQLTEDERMIRDAAHQFCQEKLLPRVQEAFRKEHFDFLKRYHQLKQRLSRKPSG